MAKCGADCRIYRLFMEGIKGRGRVEDDVGKIWRMTTGPNAKEKQLSIYPFISLV